MKILVYGCYGYTGKLIAELAAKKGLPVLLAGRNAEKVAAVSQITGLLSVTAALDDAAALHAALQQVEVVIHCAGPFVDTWKAMAEACLRTQTHYLDITGEIEVFEALAGLDAAAQSANIQVLPGAGFDVVPTDCVAASLKAALPDAQHLDLAFRSLGSGMSHGTASTLVRSLGTGSLVRRNGKIVPGRAAEPQVMANFGTGPRPAFGIPWGDVATAWYTTGIPNISTCVALPKRAARMLRWSNALGWLLRNAWVRRIAQNRVDKAPAGPDAESRAKGKSQVWGRVRNAAGKEVQMHVTTPEGYTLTAMATLYIAERVIAGHWKPGFQTPASCYGADLLEKIVPEAKIQPIRA